MMQAVLVIDMIEDFVGGKFGFPGAKQIIPNIKRLLEAARERKIPVVYICDAHRKEDPELRIWGEHAMDGQPGSKIVGELSPRAGDVVLKKHTYSAFFETGLHGVLQRAGVKELVLTGVVTNICIQHSAADAFFRGYKIIVLNDCTAAVEEKIHLGALETMRQLYGAEIRSSEELLKKWWERE